MFTLRHVLLLVKFSRQEYWSGLHFLLQGIFSTEGWNPHLLCFLHWQDSLASHHLGDPQGHHKPLQRQPLGLVVPPGAWVVSSEEDVRVRCFCQKEKKEEHSG